MWEDVLFLIKLCRATRCCLQSLYLTSPHRQGPSSQHRMVWVGRDHKNHLVATPLSWKGTPPTWSGCSGPHATWPWTLPLLRSSPLSASILVGREWFWRHPCAVRQQGLSVPITFQHYHTKWWMPWVGTEAWLLPSTETFETLNLPAKTCLHLK